jgi:hypothetical protein
MPLLLQAVLIEIESGWLTQTGTILSEPAVEHRHHSATDPRDIDNHPKSRDLQVSALYNFNIQVAMARPISSGESS